MNVSWPAALCAVLCLAAGAARSHDSWLSPAREAAGPGHAAMELATGNRFPVQDVGQTAASVERARCSDGRGNQMPLEPARQQARWLEMRADRGDGAGPPLSCWLELRAAEIELQPRLIPVYLAEIRASAATRAAWAELQARGLPWRESYRKYARIELASADASPQDRAAARQPAGLGLEIVVLGDAPIAVGEPLAFQVLRDGRPLPGFPVELVSERGALGVWRETDAQGMLRHRLPFAGRWLLRATDLRLSPSRPGAWDSRFVTLAIEAP